MRTQLSRKKARFILVAIWLLPIVIISLPLWIYMRLIPNIQLCDVVWPNHNSHIAYFIILNFLFYVLPLAMIVYYYLRIRVALKASSGFPQTDDKVHIEERTSGRPLETNPTKRESSTRAHACCCRFLRNHATVHRVSFGVRVHGHGSFSLHTDAVFRVYHKRSREFLGQPINIHDCQPGLQAFLHGIFGLKKKGRGFNLAKGNALSEDKRIFQHVEWQWQEKWPGGKLLVFVARFGRSAKRMKLITWYKTF